MKSVSSFFAATYAEAREKFLRAADAAGAEIVDTYKHPMKGPGGGELATDIAWLGPRTARKLLVLVSSTHGIEGYCGSGCQVSWLENRHYGRDASADTAALLIHAINPHGFANGRRVNEDNVDLNRNFLDFSKPLPRNPDYEALRDKINPKEWNDSSMAEAERAIANFYGRPNAEFLAKATHFAQHVNPKGTGFGGLEPTWSNKTFRSILANWMQRKTDICLIDYHTGLGPFGHGDMIYAGQPGEGMARAWFDHVTPTEEQLKTSDHLANRLTGMLCQVPPEACPGARVTSGAIEYGTYDRRSVGKSTRGDVWLHAYGDPSSKQGQEMKAYIREMFFPSSIEWRVMIASRSNDILRQALNGLKRA